MPIIAITIESSDAFCDECKFLDKENHDCYYCKLFEEELNYSRPAVLKLKEDAIWRCDKCAGATIKETK